MRVGTDADLVGPGIEADRDREQNRKAGDDRQSQLACASAGGIREDRDGIGRRRYLAR